MLTVGAMQLPQPEPLDDLGAFLRGLEPDGGYWLTVRRLADHDHSGGLMGVPVAGAGGGVTSVNGETGAVVLDAADVGALTQAQADLRYALLSAVTALTARVTALETSVTAPGHPAVPSLLGAGCEAVVRKRNAGPHGGDPVTTAPAAAGAAPAAPTAAPRAPAGT